MSYLGDVWTSSSRIIGSICRCIVIRRYKLCIRQQAGSACPMLH